TSWGLVSRQRPGKGVGEFQRPAHPGLALGPGKPPMSKAITVILLCGFAGSVIAYGFVSGSNSRQRHLGRQQDDAMLGDKEVGTLLAAAAGAWRAARRAGSPSGAELASA